MPMSAGPVFEFLLPFLMNLRDDFRIDSRGKHDQKKAPVRVGGVKGYGFSRVDHFGSPNRIGRKVKLLGEQVGRAGGQKGDRRAGKGAPGQFGGGAVSPHADQGPEFSCPEEFPGFPADFVQIGQKFGGETAGEKRAAQSFGAFRR